MAADMEAAQPLGASRQALPAEGVGPQPIGRLPAEGGIPADRGHFRNGLANHRTSAAPPHASPDHRQLPTSPPHLEQLGTPPHRLLRTRYRTHGSQVLRNHTGRGQLRSIQNEA